MADRGEIGTNYRSFNLPRRQKAGADDGSATAAAAARRRSPRRTLARAPARFGRAPALGLAPTSPVPGAKRGKGGARIRPLTAVFTLRGVAGNGCGDEEPSHNFTLLYAAGLSTPLVRALPCPFVATRRRFRCAAGEQRTFSRLHGTERGRGDMGSAASVGPARAGRIPLSAFAAPRRVSPVH
jgi:hypothetical protein